MCWASGTRGRTVALALARDPSGVEGLEVHLVAQTLARARHGRLPWGEEGPFRPLIPALIPPFSRARPCLSELVNGQEVFRPLDIARFPAYFSFCSFRRFNQGTSLLIRLHFSCLVRTTQWRTCLDNPGLHVHCIENPILKVNLSSCPRLLAPGGFQNVLIGIFPRNSSSNPSSVDHHHRQPSPGRPP